MKLFGFRPFVSKRVWKRSAKIIGRVANYRMGNRRLSGLVLSSGSPRSLYNPWISKEGSYYCDCEGYEGAETICSHILALVRKADFDGFDIDPLIKGQRGEYEGEEEIIYETSLECYNQLFSGLRTGKLSAVVSPPDIGKSLLMATFMVDMVNKHKKNALLIDTEGGFTEEWLGLIAERMGVKDLNVETIRWRVMVGREGGDSETLKPFTVAPKKADKEAGKKAKKGSFNYNKFKIPEKTDKPTIYIYNARHVVQVAPFFGRPLMFKIKSGVIEPLEAGNLTSIWDSPVGRLVEERNIGMVILDSLSSPIESFFTGGQINYRTRAKAEQAILGRGQDLVDEYPVVFMITVHATIAHNNPYAKPGMVGGKAVLHNVKYVCYMERYSGSKVAKAAGLDVKNLRMLQIFRHPMKTPWTERSYCQTTGAGIQDFDRSKYLKGEDE